MPDDLLGRRSFLSACTIGLLGLISGVVGAPVIAFITSPLRRKAASPEIGGGFADAGAIDSFNPAEWKLAPIEIVRQDGWAKSRESRSVWVRRKEAGSDDLIVLSPICTHLGCPIALSSGPSQFRCPCHGGEFNTDGKRISGPPPRDMDSLDHQVRDGHLWVRWQDFKTGVAERVTVRV